MPASKKAKFVSKMLTIHCSKIRFNLIKPITKKTSEKKIDYYLSLNYFWLNFALFKSILNEMSNMRKIFLSLFFSFILGTLSAQNTFKITYKPVSKDCAKVYLTLFYDYDTLADVIDYDVLIEKKGEHFEKELPIRSENLIAIGVNFYEVLAEYKDDKSGKTSFVPQSAIILDKAKPNLSKKFPILPRGKKVPEHLLYFCNEAAFLEQIKENPDRSDVYGFFFSGLLNKKINQKSDSLHFYFEKYGKDALFNLADKKDAKSIFSAVILSAVAGEKEKSLQLLRNLFEIAHYSAQYYLAEGFYNFLSDEKHFAVENYGEYLQKNPISFLGDAAKGSPSVFPNMQLNFDTAKMIHEHFYKAAGQHSFLTFYHKGETYFSYNMLDSAYLYSKSIANALYGGKIDVSFDAPYGYGNVVSVFLNTADYEIKKGQHSEAVRTLSPVFHFYNEHYSKLGVVKDNINGIAELKAEAHAGNGQLDSALTTCIAAYKHCKRESLLKKANEYFVKKHGSEGDYAAYLAKCDIKYIKAEAEKAPLLNFTSLSGEKFSADSLKGKIIVMNFWGTFCNPCLKEIPLLNGLKEKFANEKDVIFLAVTRENEEIIKSFQQKKASKFDFEHITSGQNIIEDFKIQIFPTNIVINRRGEIIFKREGYDEDIDMKLNRAVEKSL